VVTIGALLGMAAHLEGKGIGIIDMIGLAQKGGAVLSHLRIAQSPAAVHVPRVASGTADLVLGGDLVVTGGAKALSTIRHGHTRMLVNSYEMVTGDFTRNADWLFPNLELKHNIEQVCGEGQAEFLDSTRIATHLLGDAIAGNLFLLGFAYQRGLIPLSAEALEQAIALNGVAVEMNRSAFRWGRQAAVDLGSVRRAAFSEDVPEARSSEPTLEELVAHREQELVRYQSRAYARRYRALVDCVRQAESRLSGTASPERPLTEAVARSAFKLMAYKDEYEVARLYTNGDFLRQLEEAFEGTPEIRLHLAPPLWSRRDPISGEPIKQTFGPWMLQAMKALARFKFLRGTPLDLFGRTEERQMERQLIRDYEQSIERLLSELGAENLTIAVQIASLPEQIRGFDLVKRRNVEQVRAEEARLWEQFHCVSAPVSEPQT